MNQSKELRYTREEINNALKKGDEEVFEYLFKTLFSPLVSYAFKLVSNSEEAKEIVQEAFIHLWNRKDNIEIKSSVHAYFYKIVKNRSLNYLQSKYFNDNNKLEEYGEFHFSDLKPDNEIEEKNLTSLLNNIINSLPKKTKIVFELSRKDELTYSEISSELNISIKTVEFHISSALKF